MHIKKLNISINVYDENYLYIILQIVSNILILVINKYFSVHI